MSDSAHKEKFGWQPGELVPAGPPDPDSAKAADQPADDEEESDESERTTQ